MRNALVLLALAVLASPFIFLNVYLFRIAAGLAH